MSPVAAGGVVADARIALIDAIVGDMQRGRPYYDVVVRQLLALRKTFTDPPPYAGLVLACDLEECQKKLATAKTIIVDEMSVIRSLQHERSAAQAEADRLRVDAERYRWLRNNLMTESLNAHEIADYAYQQGSAHDFDAAIDTAIHSAKTEQERGE